MCKLKKYISKKTVFAVVMSLCFSFNMHTYAEKSISELNNEHENLKSQSEKTQDSLDGTKKEKSDILQEVERLDSELTAVQEEINELNKKLEETKKNLTENENDLKKAKEDKEAQIDIFKKRIRVMYESGNEGYLEIILESKDFSDFLKRLEYADRIIEFDQNIIDEYEETEKRIQEDIENIKIKKAEIEKLSNEEAEKKADLDKRIEEKEDMVRKLSDDEQKYLQKLQDLKDADMEIQILIQKEQARLAAKRKSTSNTNKNKTQTNSSKKSSSKKSITNKNTASKSTTNNSSVSNTSNNTPIVTEPPQDTDETTAISDDGKMQYPVPEYNNSELNEDYGYRPNPINGEDELHDGIDLKATMNTDVVAAETGTVIYSGQRGGYGNTVIIDHGDGTSTLYAHNSTLDVNVGDEVKKGQVIAKAGTTGYSTGVHVHFEVRENGKAVDPTPYLK